MKIGADCTPYASSINMKSTTSPANRPAKFRKVDLGIKIPVEAPASSSKSRLKPMDHTRRISRTITQFFELQARSSVIARQQWKELQKRCAYLFSVVDGRFKIENSLKFRVFETSLDSLDSVPSAVFLLHADAQKCGAALAEVVKKVLPQALQKNGLECADKVEAMRAIQTLRNACPDSMPPVKCDRDGPVSIHVWFKTGIAGSGKSGRSMLEKVLRDQFSTMLNHLCCHAGSLGFDELWNDHTFEGRPFEATLWKEIALQLCENMFELTKNSQIRNTLEKDWHEAIAFTEGRLDQCLIAQNRRKKRREDSPREELFVECAPEEEEACCLALPPDSDSSSSPMILGDAPQEVLINSMQQQNVGRSVTPPTPKQSHRRNSFATLSPSASLESVHLTAMHGISFPSSTCGRAVSKNEDGSAVSKSGLLWGIEVPGIEEGTVMGPLDLLKRGESGVDFDNFYRAQSSSAQTSPAGLCRAGGSCGPVEDSSQPSCGSVEMESDIMDEDDDRSPIMSLGKRGASWEAGYF